MLVSCQTRVLRIDEMSKDLQNHSHRVNSLTDQLVFQGMCWEHCSGLHRPPCLRYDDAGAYSYQNIWRGTWNSVWVITITFVVILLYPPIDDCCQVELLNCMSAASKPEEAGEECFAQFGADWAPVQVRLCLCLCRCLMNWKHETSHMLQVLFSNWDPFYEIKHNLIFEWFAQFGVDWAPVQVCLCLLSGFRFRLSLPTTSLKNWQITWL